MKSSATKWKVSGSDLALSLVGVAQAHHSGSVYDPDKRQTYTGVLSQVEWVAPHVLIHVDVKDASGKVTPWVFEGSPPAWYHHRNIKRSDVERGLGQMVKITGLPARTGIALGRVEDIQFADGSHWTPGTYASQLQGDKDP